MKNTNKKQIQLKDNVLFAINKFSDWTYGIYTFKSAYLNSDNEVMLEFKRKDIKDYNLIDYFLYMRNYIINSLQKTANYSASWGNKNVAIWDTHTECILPILEVIDQYRTGYRLYD